MVEILTYKEFGKLQLKLYQSFVNKNTKIQCAFLKDVSSPELNSFKFHQINIFPLSHLPRFKMNSH